MQLLVYMSQITLKYFAAPTANIIGTTVIATVVGHLYILVHHKSAKYETPTYNQSHNKK